MKFLLLLVVLSVIMGTAESLRMKRNAEFDSVKLNRWLASRMKRDVSEMITTPDLMDGLMANYMMQRLANSAAKRDTKNYMNKRAPKWRW